MKRSALFLLTTVIAVMSVAAAQNSTSTTRPPTPVFGFGFGPAGSAISPKPHAPFSAVLTQHTEQILSDGTTITRDNQEIVMRDSMGRIYRGREIKLPEGTHGEPHLLFTICDPVEHVQYVCSSIPKHCRKMGYRDPSSLRRPTRTASGNHPDITVEDLGTANISGVDVQGERITRIIPEGRVGNDRPITSTQETWHSKELEVDVEVKRTDPRAGTRTNTITDLNLGEPDAVYFQVPEGYKVQQGGIPSGGMSPLVTESDNSYPAGTMPPHQ